MITSRAFRGKRYAVLGLARSGLAAVEALVASGASVTAWDDRDEARAALPVGVDVADLLELDLAGYDAVVVSPGIPINRHPIAAHAQSCGVPLICDIELFAQARADLPLHKVVGITGTNGKSTTTALVQHLLQHGGIASLMGGNIGLPIMSRDPLPQGGVYVLELSSYQIDLTHSLACDIAVLTNITPDHLDRYDGFDAYVASKLRIFAMQQPGQVAIIAIDDELTKSLAESIEFACGKATKLTTVSVVKSFGQENWPSLQGPHNAQNAVLAECVARELGVASDKRWSGLQSYPGLPHRMERVRELRDVLYVNDSKATNATSAAPALAAYPAVHWILGGQAKSNDLDACMPFFNHVLAAYTIGEAGPMFARLLQPVMHVEECGILEEAVKRASLAAQPGDTVLLSPACASFDQYLDFEARGNAFRQAVGSLA